MADERQVIIVNPEAQSREQFAEDMKYLREHPLDKSPKAGGYFINADGLGAHDAEGNPVALRSADAKLAGEIRATSQRRKEAEAEAGTEALDSPEEVADRERAVREAGGSGNQTVFTPAAVREGAVLAQDGTTSQPGATKRQTRRKSTKRAKKASAE